VEFVTLAEGLDHPEGAALGPDGTVYAGGEAGQIYRIGSDGAPDAYADTGGFLYGVTVDGGGNVYGCDMGRAEVVRVDPAGAVTTYSRGTDERPLRVPNFSAFDDAGNLYVTDSGEWGADDGFLFRVAPGGETTMWSDAVTAFPNGCCLSAAGDALLVVESHTRRVVRVPIMADGSAGVPELVADLTGSQPDGIALAADGTMFVGCYRPDRVWRIAPGGMPEIWLDDPDGVVLNQPANPVFVGAGLGRLLLSSLGGWSLVTTDPGVAGLPLRYPVF
jgi:gluconolactonase